ncbi:unnamed protein product [Symbiodinium necroappetens]|uniref:Uncharacterized protein n=1 Tax=Symbiodinium necroappetens TaxID=1628268 RepID=A0A812XIE4_9DINO|nr:unnamed protein product [Symbiodinium necroappetens]
MVPSMAATSPEVATKRRKVTPPGASTIAPSSQCRLLQDFEDGENCDFVATVAKIEGYEEQPWTEETGHERDEPYGGGCAKVGFPQAADSDATAVDKRPPKRSRQDPQRSSAEACYSNSFDALTPEEFDWFTRVPRFLAKEIGLEFERLPAKQCVHVFHQRYLTGQQVDYRYDTRELSTGEVVARLVTPSFYDRIFEGPSRSDAKEAMVAVAEHVFIKDLQVNRAASRLTPAIDRIRRHVTNMLERPGLKASLTRGGVNIKMLTQDSIKAIFQGFQGKGCRTALWDGNQ